MRKKIKNNKIKNDFVLDSENPWASPVHLEEYKL